MSSSSREKAEVISFKADAELAAALNTIENRSEFIRQALRMSLDHQCPLCAGTGVLDADQQRHLRVFLQHHEIHECERCHARHLDDKTQPPPVAESCPPPSSTRKRGRATGRRRIAAALTSLFMLATLAASAHGHDHDDHSEHAGADASRGVCSACIFASSPFMAGYALQITLADLPVYPLPSLNEPNRPFLRIFYPRARAPPLSRV